MLVKAFIKGKIVDNKYSIYIPSQSANNSEYICEATLSYQPGIFNAYHDGDCVFISQEGRNGGWVIVGKLYTGIDQSQIATCSVDNLNVHGDSYLNGNVVINGKNFEELLNQINAIEKRLEKLGG